MAKHLEDIGKDAKDVLTLDFPNEGSVKFTTQSKTAENVTVKSAISRVLKRDKTVREVVTATFEDKLELPAQNIEINGKISSNRDVSGSVAVKDLAVSGSKFELNVSQTADGLAATPQVIFKNNSVAVKGKVIYPISGKKSDIKLFAEAGFVASNLHVGLGTTVTLEPTSTVIQLEGVGSYSHNNSQITARMNHTLQSALVAVGISFYQLVCPSFKIAVEATGDITGDKIALTAGGEYKVDKATTVKGKFGYKQNKKVSDIRSALSLKQQICPSLTAVFGSDLNAFSLLGLVGGDPHSFGLELKFDHK
jgi:hypothetical protein